MKTASPLASWITIVALAQCTGSAAAVTSQRSLHLANLASGLPSSSAAAAEASSGTEVFLSRTTGDFDVPLWNGSAVTVACHYAQSLAFLGLLLALCATLPCHYAQAKDLMQQFSEGRIEVEKGKHIQRFRKSCDLLYDKAVESGKGGQPDLKVLQNMVESHIGKHVCDDMRVILDLCFQESRPGDVDKEKLFEVMKLLQCVKERSQEAYQV
eukprot:TRINITY_DN126380_c0_g1_i1.p2 TRINITY_DN126380_c0_g1~~TRINITY_DN126380_c0_g1_i1.p2  ORF type:complete len:240 (+),score=73.01 TRINITY_DN126380_c0_g1_i1:87-722(+)